MTSTTHRPFGLEEIHHLGYFDRHVSLLGMDRVNSSRLSAMASRLAFKVMGPGGGGGGGGDGEDDDEDKDESVNDDEDRSAVEGVVPPPSSSPSCGVRSIPKALVPSKWHLVFSSERLFQF